MLVVNEEDSTNNQHHTPSLPSSHPTSSFWHKHPSSFLLHHRTTAALPSSADVVIIGSGISGAFAARTLSQEEGMDVLMLEAREACWGATGRVRTQARKTAACFWTLRKKEKKKK